jgi:phosphoglycerate dehydrogenase-like enzyme
VICLVTGPIPPAALADLADLEPEVRFVVADDAVPDLLAAAELAFAWDFRRSLDDVLTHAHRVRWIHAASAGVEHLLTPTVVARDIAISNSTGVFERPIAEYVLALVLAHAKGLLETHRAQRARQWAYRETSALTGATLVVVGAGRIGRAVGELADAAGMRVIGVRRHEGPAQPPFSELVGRGRLHEVLPDADYVVICAAATEDNRHLVDREALALLSPVAYLINVARGSLLDQDALAEALRGGRLAGAALDVFDQEPLSPDSPLWSVPNLLISPHMSADTTGWDRRVVEVFRANLGCFRRGEPLPSQVNSSRGY